ncbi:hypothetical protein QAD02_020295 [Eretmocerus hayati]|uniref:Uncharacterized protein n=1 Tax=Eretmocerus hayati TaxID=131215 RepID=A0ACC2PM37_9HYME|nr:hypothetical protein QAD02_020295 [Eretmocerus hayati]
MEPNSCIRKRFTVLSSICLPNSHHTHFVTAFEATVIGCFSDRITDLDLDECVDKLAQALISAQVSQTLKIHVILNYLEHCLHLLKSGLGTWSEQDGDSIHWEFLKHWNRYEVNSMQSPSYAEKLKEAVVEFSSQHLK